MTTPLPLCVAERRLQTAQRASDVAALLVPGTRTWLHDDAHGRRIVAAHLTRLDPS